MPCSLWARQVGKLSRPDRALRRCPRRCRGRRSPSIPRRSAASRRRSPSSGFVRNRTSACATVRRTVLPTHRMSSRRAVAWPSNVLRSVASHRGLAAASTRQPEIDQRAELRGHRVDRLLVADLAVEPALGRLGENRPPDREAADASRPPARRRSSPSASRPAPRGRAARRRGSRDRARRSRRRSPPGRGRRLRLELPPVGPEARVVELGERARDRVVVDRAGLRGDDLDQDLAADLARGFEGRDELRRLLALQRRRRRPDGRSTGP